MLRLNDFKVFYDSIIVALDTYIDDAHSEKPQSWLVNAQQFKNELTQHTQSSHSLLDLKNILLTFCDTLRSPFNKILNSLVGPFWSKDIGERLGAPGSRLQKALTTIATAITPFSAVYIIDEIQKAKENPLKASSANSSYISFNVHDYDHEYLSEEGLRILCMIVNDEVLTQTFLRQAKHYVSETQAQHLLKGFIDEYKPRRFVV